MSYVMYVVVCIFGIYGTAQGIEGYVLVTFEDEDTTAVVPGRKIECDRRIELKEGDVVNVTWSDGNQYTGTVVTFGMCITLVIRYCLKLINTSGNESKCRQKQVKLEKEKENESFSDEKPTDKQEKKNPCNAKNKELVDKENKNPITDQPSKPKKRRKLLSEVCVPTLGIEYLSHFTE